MKFALRALISLIILFSLSCKSKPPEKPPGALEQILSEDEKSYLTLFPDRIEMSVNAHGQMGKQHNTDGVQVYSLDGLLRVKRNGYITSFLVVGGENWTEINFMPFGSAEGAVTLERGLNKILEDEDAEAVEE